MATDNLKTTEQTLYERLGGEEGIKRMANDVLDKNYNNPEIGHFFKDVDMDQLKRRVFEFFSFGTGGPHQYTGKEMKPAHKDLGISKRDFELANEDTVEVMKAHGYDQALIDEVIGILDSMRGDVITR